MRVVSSLLAAALAAVVIAAPARAACSGDCDASGTVSQAEAQGVRSALLGRSNGCDAADADGSGRVTVRDALLASRAASSGSCAVAVHVTGRVLFDDGTPIAGAMVTAAVQVPVAPPVVLGAMNAGGKPGLPTRPQAGVRLASAAPPVATGADGSFAIDLQGVEVPQDVLVSATFTPLDGPPLDNGRVKSAGGPNLAVGDILLPSLVGAKMTLAGGSGETPDGDVRIAGLPPGVAAVYAQSYDPDADPEAFPGSFTEQGKLPLDSQGFQFVQPVDADGNPVSEVDDPALVQGKLPPAQLPGIQDAVPGTDRIELPIYTYDEATGQWVEDGMGWVQDENGAVLPEAAESAVQNNTVGGKLYAAFPTDHFSWFNVDYPYVGPWQLAAVPRDLRNNDCFYRAMRLAEAYLRSAWGAAAFRLVNTEHGDLASELGDGLGPFVRTEQRLPTATSATVGWYEGDAVPRGGSERFIWLNSLLWQFCNGENDDDLVLFLASVIIHETAHWKDDVYKHASGDDALLGPGDTRGDEGAMVEQAIFGGLLSVNVLNGQLLFNGAPIDPALREQLMRPWDLAAPAGGVAMASQPASPLEVSVTVPAGPFPVGTSIPATVTLRNTGATAIPVVTTARLEDIPLRFDLRLQPSGAPVGFLGAEEKTQLGTGAFTSLAAGASTQVVVDLVVDGDGVPARYSMRSPGTYCGNAVYEAGFGVAEAQSAEFCVSVSAGGAIAGTVHRAADGSGLQGATVVALLSGAQLGSSSTDADGAFRIDGLPPGTYEVRASAPGFLNSTAGGVSVSAGATTSVDLNLSSLLTAGQLRMVLTWSAQPRDLDSHLWLPTAFQYHVFYGQEGDAQGCPNAELDVDDTDGFGPETVTISRFRASGMYRYAIYNYSQETSIAGSGARVDVFDATGLIRTITVPGGGAGTWWHVLDIDADTKAITEVNQVAGDPSPYGGYANSCPVEDCSNGIDDDEDGMTDCADVYDCADIAPCSESDDAECANGLDDDGDGAADCLDYGCYYAPGCREQGPECFNQADDDGDGSTDCTDPDCYYDCIESYRCSDGFDNDSDGFTDCLDTECRGGYECMEDTNAQCHDGIDNDGDTVVDCAETSCGYYCIESNFCDDGVDNEGDQLTDCFDPECAAYYPCAEDAFDPCHDGLDNDHDGATDCQEQACSYYCDESQWCSDEIDDDGDGLTDCHDPDCGAYWGCLEDSHDNCLDGRDNDVDGATDCQEQSCAQFCIEADWCDDTSDNDGDGLVDCHDADCSAFYACTEDAHDSCLDGLDNDFDGATDCQEQSCAAFCVEADWCTDVEDNDGDGLMDCMDSDCASVPYRNCNGSLDDGCETDVANDPANCATCNTRCPPRENAYEYCQDATCRYDCIYPFADCDENPGNGCEKNLYTDNSNCGTCGNVCDPGTTCTNGTCQGP